MQNIEKRKERRKKKVGALEKAVLNNSVQHQMNYFVMFDLCAKATSCDVAFP